MLLFGTEYSVACVTETGNDISVVVKLFIKSGNVNIYVGMVCLDFCHAFGSGNQTHKADMLAAACLEQCKCSLDGQSAAAAGIAGAV